MNLDFPARHTAGLGQMGRFFGAGACATLIHWGVIAVLMWQGVAALPASVAGGVAGALCNYIMQARWVFSCRSAMRSCRFAAHVCTVGLGWGLNAAVLYVLLAIVHPALAQLFASAAASGLHFLLYRGVVFYER